MIESNQILHGDCLELMPLIPDKSIDMILCDLPYGTTACKWDVIIPFEPLWAQYKRIIKDNGAIVLFASQPFTSALVMSNIKMFKYCWVWDKRTVSGFAFAKYQPMRAYEDVCVFGFGRTTYNPLMVERTETELKRLSHNSIKGKSVSHFPNMVMREQCRNNAKLKYPSSVLRINGLNGRNGEKCGHPTQKPVALFEYLIKTYTNEGETVLDNCSGSGTTAIACINTNRNYICMEKEKKYFDVSVERVKNHQAQLKLTL